MSILGLLNQIRNQEIVLPNIQREFVWSEEKIYKLMDSIMRGYPIGIILMWETYNNIRYRKFSQSSTEEADFSFFSNENNDRITLVLDGQQRLQSLYISLYGTYDGKSLYLNLLSGEDKDNTAEIAYEFRFLKNSEMENENQESEMQFSKLENDDPDTDFEKWYYKPVSDVFNMSYEERAELIDALANRLNLDRSEKMIVDRNLNFLKDNLTSNEIILRQSVLDQNKALKAKDRKTIHDILEIFVRVNTEGTRLTRSDLIFSMLKLNWQDAALDLPRFVEKINEGNTFNFNKDFVIKCLFSVSDFGPKYDIDILRKKSNVEIVEKNYGTCCKAICACIDFVRQQCWINSRRVLPGINLLIPFVYYFFNLPEQKIKVQDIPNLRKFFYFAAFTKVFTRWSDARIKQYTRDYLRPIFQKNEYAFPFERSMDYIRRKNYGFEGLTDGLLNSSLHLGLNLIQHNFDINYLDPSNEPERDHIFPRSELMERKFPESEIDFYANYWYLPRSVNRNKSNKTPKAFMKENNISLKDLENVFIDPDLLDYQFYLEFIQSRAARIREYISSQLELNSG